MALHGSSFPLDDGSFVTTVHCPNAFAHQRLMQAINNIVPDAGAIAPQPGAIPAEPGAITPYIAGFEPNEDGVIVPGCASGVAALTKHLSLTAWGPVLSRTYGDVNLLYVNLDWLCGVDDHQPWFSLAVGLLGFCACLTFWPRGKLA